MSYIVKHPDGKIQYFRNEQMNELHREDGPAVVFPNGEEWYIIDGKLHRTDGPAIVRKLGISEYWIDGVKQDASEALEAPEVEESIGKQSPKKTKKSAK